MSAARTLIRFPGRGRSTPPPPASVAVDAGDVAYRHHHLYVNGEGTWAVFVLGEVDAVNRPPHVLEALVEAQAHRWAALAGRRVRLWGLPLAFPHVAFVERMHSEFPDHARGDAGRAAQFEEMQERKAAFARLIGARQLVPVLAVQVTAGQTPREYLPLLLRAERCPDRLGVIEAARQELRQITASVARPGWGARPVSEAGLTWALRVSRTPGFPAPSARLDRWDAFTEAAGFGDAPRVTAAEFGPHVTVRGIRDGREVTRYATTLRVDDIESGRDTDDVVPWLAWLDSLGPTGDDDSGWRVQWAADFRMVGGREQRRKAAWRLKLTREIARHYDDHGADEDRQIARAADRAEDIVDEVAGKPHVAVRGVGHVTVTVSAETIDGLQTAVESVIDAAAEEQGMTLVQGGGQWADYRRSIVGNHWDSVGHELPLPAPFLAAGVPNLSAAAGDAAGFMCGPIAGSNSVYVFNALDGPRHGKAGVGVINGAQGAGKTTTAVAIAADLVDSGVPGVAFSPDGMITQIARARNIAPHYRGIPLTQVRTPGVAMPSLMIPDPPRLPGPSDEERRAEVDAATAVRVRYERDVLTAVLPGVMQRSDAGHGMAIEEAVAASGGAYGVSPWVHVAWLERQTSQTARDAARMLRARAAQPAGRLVFPDPSADDTDRHVRAVLESDALFTCLTTPGIVLPQTPVREDWTDEEWESIPVLMSGLRLATRALFSTRERGWFVADELDIATGGVGAFSSFVRLLIYDVRRYNKWAALVTKSMSTLRALDEDVTSLLGWVMQGRVGDDVGAASAMRLLGEHVDPGVRHELLTLADGEWFIRGWDGRVRRVPFDQAWWQEDLIRHTYTKPEEARPRLATAIRSW